MEKKPIVYIVLVLYTIIGGLALSFYEIFKGGYILESLQQIGNFVSLTGVMVLMYLFLAKKLFIIEGKLNVDEDTDDVKLSMIKYNPFDAWLTSLNKKKYFYKVGLFLSNPSIDDLVFVKKFLNEKEIDSDIRLLVHIKNENISVEEKLQNIHHDISTESKNKIEIKKLKKQTSTTTSIIIIDNNIWVIYYNLDDTKNSILLESKTYSETGRKYVELFNRNWGSANSK